MTSASGHSFVCAKTNRKSFLHKRVIARNDTVFRKTEKRKKRFAGAERKRHIEKEGPPQSFFLYVFKRGKLMEKSHRLCLC
jgi:hypothetical protein